MAVPEEDRPHGSATAWASNPKSVSAAIAYAAGQEKARNPIWYRRCLAFVGRCYGLPATGTSYAIDIWSRMPVAMRHTGSSNIPAGALLLYRTGSRAGHIALYAGNGNVYSNDIKGNGKIGLVKFGDLVGGIWNLDYVGWTPPYFPDSPLSHIAGSMPAGDTAGATTSGTPAPTDGSTALDSTLSDTVAWAQNPESWYRILYVIGGAAAVFLALQRMENGTVTGLAESLAGTAPKVKNGLAPLTTIKPKVGVS